MNLISAEGFRTLVENVPDGFFIHDESGRLLDLSERCCAELGYTRAELLQMSILDISDGLARGESPRIWREASAGFSANYRDVTIHRDGTRMPVEVRLTCQMVDGHKLFLGVALDRDAGEDEALIEQRIDERVAALRLAHDRLAMAAAGGGLGIWDYDIARDAMQCDPQWYRVMGRDPARPIRSVAEFRTIIHPDDAERATEVRDAAEWLDAGEENYGIIFRIVRSDGTLRWIRSAASIIRDGDGVAIRAVGFVIDITDAQDAMASLERKTREDSLTGLANRRHFDEELRKACLHATRTGEPLTLVMVDVDHFKLFNDAEGHLRGDAVLMAVADILRGAARRPYDLAARYGGEEFVLLLPGVNEPGPILQCVVDELAARAIPHVASPVASHLTISCGCVVAVELADLRPIDLLGESDRALYRAKEAGRNRIIVSRL